MTEQCYKWIVYLYDPFHGQSMRIDTRIQTRAYPFIYLFDIIILYSLNKYLINNLKIIIIREGINQYILGKIMVGVNIKIQFN